MIVSTNSPESGQHVPLLPSERQPDDFAKRDRVFALYYRTWMAGPELVQGVISSVVPSDRPHLDGSLGFVSIKTPQTPDNRTGSFTGIDMNSAALIPADVLPRMKDESFLEDWLANGTFAWESEREMLEEALRERIAQGNIGWDMTPDLLDLAEEHDDAYGVHHPTRAREHAKMIPGSAQGKVAAIRLRDLVGDDEFQEEIIPPPMTSSPS